MKNLTDRAKGLIVGMFLGGVTVNVVWLLARGRG